MSDCRAAARLSGRSDKASMSTRVPPGRRFSVRSLLALLLAGAVFLGSACGRQAEAPPPSVEASASIQGGYRPGTPVSSESGAAAAGMAALDRPGFAWMSPPKAALAEQMTYEAANKRIGLSGGSEEVWPREAMVWLVIFEGRWQLTPMGSQSSQPLTYEGCLFALVAARDGSMLQAGDAACPGRP